MKIIEVPYDFSSYEFYSNILSNVFYNNEKRIIIDFSSTRIIEPLVVPNLLCLGYIVKHEMEITPELLIPDTFSGGKLKKYLDQIGFTDRAYDSNLFKFTFDPYGGLMGKNIDPLCGTKVFNASNTIDDIYRGINMFISPFSEKYLTDFQTYDENYRYVNEITEFLVEILVNCKVHAKSFSITTLHANYKVKKIYISVSDVGYGFFNTIDGEGIENEKQAVLKGIYKRKESKVYGLYNVIRRVLEFNGKIRIHSNDTQIIFTPRLLREFVDGKLCDVPMFEQYNVKNTPQYDGVHIEIELPLKRG